MALWLSELGANGAAGGLAWVDRGVVTLSGGVLDASAGPGLYTVAAETGTADNLTQITGLTLFEGIRIQPDTGDTITVKDGAKLHLQGVDFPMDNVNDLMELTCNVAGDECTEVSRADNN